MCPLVEASAKVPSTTEQTDSVLRDRRSLVEAFPFLPNVRDGVRAETRNDAAVEIAAASGALLLEVLDHGLKIRKARAEEGPRERIAAPGRYDAFVNHHVELTDPARHHRGLHVEALTDEGDETRRLGV